MPFKAVPNTYKCIYHVFIKAPQKEIWAALTNAEWTQKYGYGWRIEFELRFGGGFWVFIGEKIKQNGLERGIKIPDLLFTGNVAEVDAPHRLALNWQMEIDSQTHEKRIANLTYEIAGLQGGFSKLTLTLDRKQAANYPLRPEGIATGFEDFNWRLTLCDLKSLLETGKGFML